MKPLKVFDKEDLYNFFKYILPNLDEKAFLKVYYEWVDEYRIDYQENFIESVKYDRLLEEVCQVFGVTVFEFNSNLRNKRTSKPYVLIKKCISYICFKMYNIPVYVIKDKLKYINSRAITWNVKDFEELLKKDTKVSNKFNELINRLK